MNLVQQLFATVTPLSDYVKDCEQRQKERAATKQNWARNNKAANEAIRNAAIARYRKVMGEEWVKTMTIESRLGMSRGSCTPNLNRWVALGLIEKRRALVPGKWCKSDGNEWRFIK